MDDQGGIVAFCFLAAGIMLLSFMMLDRCSTGKGRGPAPELGIETLLQAPTPNLRSLRDLRGQAVVLEFWATWCDSCKESIPHMNRLHASFKDKPVTFIAVTSEPEDTVKEFLADTPISGWIGLDEDEKLHKAFGVRGVPQAFVIDRHGQIALKIGPSFLYASDIEKAMTAAAPAAEQR